MGRLIYRFHGYRYELIDLLRVHRRNGTRVWTCMKMLMLGIGSAAVLATGAGISASAPRIASAWRERAHVQSEQTTERLLHQVVMLLVQIERNTRPTRLTQP